MPSQPPIPPLLSPYLSIAPFASLTLLTSTLGASTNWLVLRFIYSALKDTIYEKDGSTKEHTEDTMVVLVSWLRDGNFWKEGGRKLVSALGLLSTHLQSTPLLLFCQGKGP